jgi:hypothetical protein
MIAGLDDVRHRLGNAGASAHVAQMASAMLP